MKSIKAIGLTIITIILVGAIWRIVISSSYYVCYQFDKYNKDFLEIEEALRNYEYPII